MKTKPVFSKTTKSRTLENFPEFVAAFQTWEDAKRKLTSAQAALNEAAQTRVTAPSPSELAEKMLDGEAPDTRPYRALLAERNDRIEALDREAQVWRSAENLASKRLNTARQTASAEILKDQQPAWDAINRELLAALKHLGEVGADARRRLEANAAAGIKGRPVLGHMRLPFTVGSPRDDVPTQQTIGSALDAAIYLGDPANPKSLTAKILRAAAEAGFKG